jgi:16S rRNA (cytidine1402-2'-O)-methyltransferase
VRQKGSESLEPEAAYQQDEGGAGVEAGTLYLVATPIGNLRDITLRALDVLRQVELIAAEDTRRTRILLNRYGISTPSISFHDFNKERRTPQLLLRLRQGAAVGLVTDAGTPGISDPGFYLVRASLQEGIPVTSVPGPTAFVSGLVISGLPTDRFTFEGFLPVKKGRRKRLESLVDDPRTLIFYESPKRVPRTLRDLEGCFGDRRVAVVRELTKKFEEVVRGTLGEVRELLDDRNLKGEHLIIVEGKRN